MHSLHNELKPFKGRVLADLLYALVVKLVMDWKYDANPLLCQKMCGRQTNFKLLFSKQLSLFPLVSVHRRKAPLMPARIQDSPFRGGRTGEQHNIFPRAVEIRWSVEIVLSFKCYKSHSDVCGEGKLIPITSQAAITSHWSVTEMVEASCQLTCETLALKWFPEEPCCQVNDKTAGGFDMFGLGV